MAKPASARASGCEILFFHGENRVFRLTHQVGDRLTKMVRTASPGACVQAKLVGRPDGPPPAANTGMDAEKHGKILESDRDRERLRDSAPGARGRHVAPLHSPHLRHPERCGKQAKTKGLTVNERNDDLPAPRTHFLGSEPNGFDDHGERILKTKRPSGTCDAARGEPCAGPMPGIGLQLLRASA